MQTHGPESKWGHAILLQRKHCPPIVIHRVVALTQLPTHSQIDTCTLRETRLARLAHSKIGITHKIHSKHFTVAVISAPCSAHTPPPLYPRLTIQSEAGGDFLGVVAEPIVARLRPHCIPLPHLYSLPRTPTRPAELLLLPLLINYSGFCQDTCMRAHTNPHIRTYSIHTHTTQREESADAQGRAVGA